MTFTRTNPITQATGHHSQIFYMTEAEYLRNCKTWTNLCGDLDLILELIFWHFARLRIKRRRVSQELTDSVALLKNLRDLISSLRTRVPPLIPSPTQRIDIALLRTIFQFACSGTNSYGLNKGPPQLLTTVPTSYFPLTIVVGRLFVQSNVLLSVSNIVKDPHF